MKRFGRNKLTFVAKDGRARVSNVGVYELAGDDFVTKKSLALKPSASVGRRFFLRLTICKMSMRKTRIGRGIIPVTKRACQERHQMADISNLPSPLGELLFRELFKFSGL